MTERMIHLNDAMISEGLIEGLNFGQVKLGSQNREVKLRGNWGIRQEISIERDRPFDFPEQFLEE